jgi:L-idonate 5-dehydrogenase
VAGIWWSDLHYYTDGAGAIFTIREPLIPGNEVSGVIDLDTTGAFQAGTPVTVHPVTCGTPAAQSDRGAATAVAGWGLLGRCLDMATQARRPGRAALAEPLAVGLHALVVGGGIRASGC